MTYVLAYDLGTTSVKVGLCRIDESVVMLGSAERKYPLYTLPNGGAEQHVDEWWEAMCESTRELLEHIDLDAEQIDGITFCSQMQAMALVDEKGVTIRHPMSYMDQRAGEEMRSGIGTGVKVAGMNARKLLTSLRITGAVSGSVKDPMWKYLWVRNHEPKAFRRARWWLDAKETLIARMTGECVMTEDSAFSTFLYDTREGSRGWSRELCQMFGVDPGHLPRVIRTSDAAGRLRREQAEELGLAEGTTVFGGGGDASLIGIGTGCVHTGETHIYCGTSGWVSTVVEKQVVDTSAMIAAAVGALGGKYNYFAEMETAGKCLGWAKEHLLEDEAGVYPEKRDVTETAGDSGRIHGSMYEFMSEVISEAPAGAGGVIFTPWLHGNRCPFEDPNAAGMFFGLTLDTGKKEMLRAVVEGVCYHLRWMLECQDRKIETSESIRFCGGMARSPQIAQILSDIIGRPVEVVENPQNIGAVGAALTAAVGLGAITDIEGAADMIPVQRRFEPQREHAAVYKRNYRIFKQLHQSNRRLFARLARG